MWAIGGCAERVLPTLDDPRGPLFVSLPPPPILQPSFHNKASVSQDAEIAKLVDELCTSEAQASASAQAVWGELIRLDSAGLGNAAAALCAHAFGGKAVSLGSFVLKESDSPPPQEVQVSIVFTITCVEGHDVGTGRRCCGGTIPRYFLRRHQSKHQCSAVAQGIAL